LAQARDCRDHPGHRIHTPDPMVQRVCNVEMPCLINDNRCRKIQPGLIGRTAIATEPFGRGRTGHDITNGATQVSLLGKGMRIDSAAFGKRIPIHSFSDWRGRDGSRARSSSLNASHYRPDTVGLPVDLSNDMVLGVGNEQIAISVEGETLRFIQTRSKGRSSVAGPSGVSGTGNGLDQTSFEIRTHFIRKSCLIQISQDGIAHVCRTD
jgi:hypothetical protein